MIDILGLIAPVFLVIGAGAALRLLGAADESWVGVLNRYGLYIGFPALIFLNLLNVSVEHLYAESEVFLITALLLLALMGGALLISILAKLPKTRANTFMVAAFYGNVAYLGYPVVTSVYPGRGPETAVLISIYTLILFSFGIGILEVRRSERKSALRIGFGILRNPFIIAILLGALFAARDWQLPGPLYGALEMIADSASPVVLVSLGIFLTRRIPLRSVLRPALIITALRLAVAPALFYAAAALTGETAAFRTAVLEAAMPLAITPFALSSMYPLDRNVIVTAIFLTTLLSVVTIPLWILLLQG
jgi:hypothetical protein